MKRHLARALTIVLIGTGTLVACGNDQDACAATAGNQPKPISRTTQRPTTQRTTSKVQDRPKTTTSTSNKKSNKTTKQRPTNWTGYNDRVKQHNWTKPYRQGYPVPQQPIIINQYGHDYRTYPGYPGVYPVGVWPVGYGNKFGCSAEKEADPETTAAPLPAPTVTVTATPSTSPPPTSTPADTPR